MLRACCGNVLVILWHCCGNVFGDVVVAMLRQCVGDVMALL